MACQVYAIRYATAPDRRRGQNFVADGRPSELQPMDFFTWVIRGADATIVVDTGMHPGVAARFGYRVAVSPTSLLRRLGIDTGAVRQVILTHMHFDHIGNLEDFPLARFFVQASEMRYVTGPEMQKAWFRGAYAPEEIGRVVTYLHTDRVTLHGADFEVAPDVTVHWVGGHTGGQEVVRVRTGRGWVVLAADALHYYEEYERGIPFGAPFSASQMLAAHDRIRALADSDGHVVPGHDPLVMTRYPPAGPDLEGLVARLDLPPRPHPSEG